MSTGCDLSRWFLAAPLRVLNWTSMAFCNSISQGTGLGFFNLRLNRKNWLWSFCYHTNFSSTFVGIASCHLWRDLWALTTGCSRIIVKSYSLEAISLLNRLWPSLGPEGVWTHDIRLLATNFELCQFMHANRRWNYLCLAYNLLAKHSLHFSSSYFLFHNILRACYIYILTMRLNDISLLSKNIYKIVIKYGHLHVKHLLYFYKEMYQRNHYV